MKKCLFLILGLICISCGQPMSEKSDRIINTDSSIRLEASHFNYKNHQYIYFQKSSGNYAVGGIVHDPKCNCNGWD
jgi:hypothetical protein